LKLGDFLRNRQGIAAAAAAAAAADQLAYPIRLTISFLINLKIYANS
jgi:hypothetical protein